MAHRRQQRPQRQFQRSPGSFGPPPKRPRTAPPMPPMPPMDWEYDYDRAPRSRYPPPMYDDYQDFPPPRPPRRDFGQYHGNNDDFYRGDRRAPPRRPQQQQQPKPFRQDRQQYPYRPQQGQRGGRQQHRGGGGGGGADNWMDGNRRRQRNRQNQKGNVRRHSPGRSDDKEGSYDRNGTGFQRNWTKTYWAGKGESPSKRHDQKRPDVEIPEVTRFYILCSMIKSKFRVNDVNETFDYFLKENVSKLTPAFTFKRGNGQTTCKFYLNGINISEGKGITRSEAKNNAVQAAVAVIEKKTPEKILAEHERSEVAELRDQVDAIDYSMLSHTEKFTGEKPLNNFVLLQAEGMDTDDNKQNWTSILVQSAAFSRMSLHFQLKGQDHKRVSCNIHIDGKFIYSGRGRLVKEAKNFAAKGAVSKLDQTCYTLMIKEVEDKPTEEVSILESTGSMSGGLSEDDFKTEVSKFLQKYLDEEDITKPLVISTDGMTMDEKNAILDVAKGLHLYPKQENVKRDRPKRDDKQDTAKAEEKKEEKEIKTEDDKSAENKTEDKTSDESKMETNEENKTETSEETKVKEEEKTDEEKANTVDGESDQKSEVKEGEEKKEGDEQEMQEEEKKPEEPPKPVGPITLVRKYSGVDMLEYILNHDGETWKYRAVPPGTRKRQAEEAEKAAEEEKAKEEAEAAQEAIEGNGEDAEHHEGGDEVEDEMLDGEEVDEMEAEDAEAEGMEAEMNEEEEATNKETTE